MANITDIAKAGLMKQGLKHVFKVEPELDIQEKYVRIYYPPNRLPAVQKQLESMTKPGAVRVDIMPVIVPYVARKYGGYIILLFAAGLITGALISR